LKSIANLSSRVQKASVLLVLFSWLVMVVNFWQIGYSDSEFNLVQSAFVLLVLYAYIVTLFLALFFTTKWMRVLYDSAESIEPSKVGQSRSWCF
jgi:hypothetical protein